MIDPYIGEIQYVAFTFAPRGWAECDGQLLDISQNDALFALIGTTYGGDGITTFALPDMRGRLATNVSGSLFMGQTMGTESETLTTAQMPAHTHGFRVESGNGTVQDPGQGSFGGYLTGSRRDQAYSPSGSSTAGPVIQPAGGSQPHNNMMPFNTLRAVIALEGIFPPRN